MLGLEGITKSPDIAWGGEGCLKLYHIYHCSQLCSKRTHLGRAPPCPASLLICWHSDMATLEENKWVVAPHH